MALNTKAIALLCCLLMFAGCTKKQTETGAMSSSLKPEGHLVAGELRTGVEDEDDVREGAIESLDRTGVNPLAEDTTSLEFRQKYGRSTPPLMPVYFDFDSSSINYDQLDELNNSADYLKNEPAVQLVIEGNCDQRGTVDYNLALGEMRAMNVKKYLVNLGVDAGRIKTVSYGSERPLFHGSDEQSWAANRRADLVIP